MTRLEHRLSKIRQTQLSIASNKKRHGPVAELYWKLKRLMTEQLRAENRSDRRALRPE
jgi:hypothetical protein